MIVAELKKEVKRCKEEKQHLGDEIAFLPLR
jgi:hypothetical protein